LNRCGKPSRPSRRTRRNAANRARERQLKLMQAVGHKVRCGHQAGTPA
jgi:hypothetical protein